MWWIRVLYHPVERDLSLNFCLGFFCIICTLKAPHSAHLSPFERPRRGCIYSSACRSWEH